MGGASENVQQQPVAVPQYPYNQPQQQNMYFQPPQPIQYAPHAYAEQPVPVLQGSSIYPNVVPLQHQPVFVQAMPQQQFAAPVTQPTFEQQPQAEAPRSCRFRCSGARLKQFFANLDAYRVCGFLTVMSFVAYFLFTPHVWPWFITVAAISAGYCGTKYIKETRMMTDQEPRLYVHAIWYAALNIMFVLINLWAGRYPWSVFPLCIWGALLAIHALKVYNNNHFKTRLYVHFIIYVAALIMILVASSRGKHTPFVFFIVLSVWSLIIALHARKVRRSEESRAQSGDQQPAELQVVTSENVAVPEIEQQIQIENAQLVQNQQEVFNTIHQAQQEQRAQQNNQVHLFQPSVYPNTH